MPRMGLFSLREMAMGHWSWGNGVPSMLYSFHVTHQESVPSSGTRPANFTAAWLQR